MYSAPGGDRAPLYEFLYPMSSDTVTNFHRNACSVLYDVLTMKHTHQALSWIQASILCTKLDEHLPTVRSQEDMKHIRRCYLHQCVAYSEALFVGLSALREVSVFLGFL